MNNRDQELLSQYIDGELAPAEAQALELRLSGEPRLNTELERLRALDDAIRSEYNKPGADAVPAGVTRMVQESGSNVVAFPGKQRTAGWGFAVAASLLAASGMLFFEQQSMVADNPAAQDALLAQALESNASRADGWDQLDDGRQFRSVLSFRSTSQEWCREYLLGDALQQWRGVACRDEAGDWVVAVTSPSPASQDSLNEYRPAGADSAQDIESFVEQHADGLALGASEEAALIGKRWQ